MSLQSASQARANLYGLMDQVAESHEPAYVTGKRHNVVIIAEEDWSAIQETLYLQAIPGMTDSIKKGMKEPINKCSKDLNW